MDNNDEHPLVYSPAADAHGVLLHKGAHNPRGRRAGEAERCDENPAKGDIQRQIYADNLYIFSYLYSAVYSNYYLRMILQLSLPY